MTDLLGRHDGEVDALGEGVEAVAELELRIAAEGDHLVHLFELHADGVEAGHELVETLLAEGLEGRLGLVALGRRRGEIGDALLVVALALAVLLDDTEVDILLGLTVCDA